MLLPLRTKTHYYSNSLNSAALAKKVFILIFIFQFWVFKADGQVTIISEDFSTGSGTTPPASWTNNQVSGNASELWAFNNPGGLGAGAPISGQFAVFDSDFYGNNGTAEDVSLESPTFNASSYTTLTLTFDHYFRTGFGGAYSVDIYNGSSWTTVLSGSGSSTANAASENIDISTAANGATNAQIRFRWTGSYSWYWAVDNVILTGVIPSTDSDGDTVADNIDLDDDNDGIPDLFECAVNEVSVVVPDGAEDNNYPIGYWDAEYFEGFYGIAGSTFGNTSGDINGTGGIGSPTYHGETFFAFNSLTLSLNYSWTTSQNPTSPSPTGYVGTTYSSSGSPHYSIQFNRTMELDGTLDFGPPTFISSDDVIEIIINGTQVYFGGNCCGAPGRPQTTAASIAFSQGDEVQIKYSNIGGIGSLNADFVINYSCDEDSDNDGILNSLDLDSDNDGIWDASEAGHSESITNGRITGNVGTNGLDDDIETSADSDVLNYTVADTDGDGTYDAQELDADDDSCNDTEEANVDDPDSDGIAGTGTPTVDADGLVTSITYVTPANNDWQNASIVSVSCSDKDLDGIADVFDIDADNDGIPSELECQEVTQTFTYTGADQTYTIPAGADFITFKIWGAGGSGRTAAGAGGYTEASFRASDLPATVLIVAGGGGAPSISGQTIALGGYGGGGNGGTVTSFVTARGPGGGGGGLSGVFDASSLATATQADALLIAGGGGGGSFGGLANGYGAGAGGGSSGESAPLNGSNTSTVGGGQGGTQVAGGAGFQGGTAGSVFQGGTGASGANQTGGGGGGGYFGGGGGGWEISIPNPADAHESPGGGGSGYYTTSLAYQGNTIAGSAVTPPNTTDANYIAGIGRGDNGVNNSGGNGLVVIIATFCQDTDGDTIDDYLDLDSDNDGIPDIIEAGGADADGDGQVEYATAGDPTTMVDADNDGLWDILDDIDSGSGVGELTSGTALVVTNTDGLGNPNYIDIDSDDDGIVDNTEALATSSYIAPSSTDSDLDGLDDAYDIHCTPCGAITGVAIVPTDSDTDGDADYIDINSDNDAWDDPIEGHDTNRDGIVDGSDTPAANTGLAGGTADIDSDGLLDGFDNNTAVFDPTNNNLNPNSHPDTGGSTEQDWREAVCAVIIMNRHISIPIKQ